MTRDACPAPPFGAPRRQSFGFVLFAWERQSPDWRLSRPRPCALTISGGAVVVLTHHKRGVRQRRRGNRLPVARRAGKSPLLRSQFPRRCVHASTCGPWAGHCAQRDLYFVGAGLRPAPTVPCAILRHLSCPSPPHPARARSRWSLCSRRPRRRSARRNRSVAACAASRARRSSASPPACGWSC